MFFIFVYFTQLHIPQELYLNISSVEFSQEEKKTKENNDALGEYKPKEKKIIIYKYGGSYTLLHELGHHICFENFNDLSEECADAVSSYYSDSCKVKNPLCRKIRKLHISTLQKKS